MTLDIFSGILKYVLLKNQVTCRRQRLNPGRIGGRPERLPPSHPGRFCIERCKAKTCISTITCIPIDSLIERRRGPVRLPKEQPRWVRVYCGMHRVLDLNLLIAVPLTTLTITRETEFSTLQPSWRYIPGMRHQGVINLGSRTCLKFRLH